ncbi:girdin-like isoform X2 [Artemia franciscana]|uniref:girdin-like isoform X2 n=1 Tax=Artemia franciscana TaxID=6661 RepID=UPI0032DA3A88
MSSREKQEASPDITLDFKPCTSILTSTRNPDTGAPLVSPGLVNSTNSNPLSILHEKSLDQSTEHGTLRTPFDYRTSSRDGSPVQRFIEIADTVDTLKCAHDLSESMGPLLLDSFHIPRLGTPSNTTLSCPNLTSSSKRRRLDFREDPGELGLDIRKRFEEVLDENLMLKRKISLLMEQYPNDVDENEFNMADLIKVKDDNKKLYDELSNFKSEIKMLKEYIEELKSSHKKEIMGTDDKYETALKNKDTFYERKLLAVNSEWEVKFDNELQEIRRKDALEFERLRIKWEDDQQCELKQLQSLHEEELKSLIEKQEKHNIDVCTFIQNLLSEVFEVEYQPDKTNDALYQLRHILVSHKRDYETYVEKSKRVEEELRSETQKHIVKLHDYEEKQQALIAEFESNVRLELDKLQSDFTKLQEEYAAEIRAKLEILNEKQELEKELHDQEIKHQLDITQLRQELEQIASRSLNLHTCDPIGEHEALIHKLSENATTIAEYEAMIHKLKGDFDQQIIDLETKHIESLKSVRSDFESKLSQVETASSRIEEDHKKLINSISEEKKRIEKEVIESYSEQMADLAAKHTLEKITLEAEVSRLKEDIETLSIVTDKNKADGSAVERLLQELKEKDIELEQLKNAHENHISNINEDHRKELNQVATISNSNGVQKRVEELEEYAKELKQQLEASNWYPNQQKLLKDQSTTDSGKEEDGGASVLSPEPLEKIKGVNNHHIRLEAIFQDLRRQLSELSGPVPPVIFKTTDLLHSALEAAVNEVEEETNCLCKQLEAADKKIKSLRQFLADQAEEREAERYDLQAKVSQLENLLLEKDKEKVESIRLAHEIETLERQLDQRHEMCRNATEASVKLEKALKMANEKITDLNMVILKSDEKLSAKQVAESQLREELDILRKTLIEQGKVQQELNDQIEFLRQINGDRPVPDGAASNFGSDRSDSPQARAATAEPPHLFQELKDLIQVLMERVERKTRELEALQLSNDSDTSRAVSPITEDVSVKDRIDRRFISSTEELRGLSQYEALQLQPFEDLNKLNGKLEQLSKIEEMAVKRVKDMEMQLRSARDTERNLQEELNSVKEQLRKKSYELKELEANMDNLTRYNLELKSERDELQGEFSSKERVIAGLEMRIASMEPAVNSLGSFEELKMKLKDTHHKQEELQYLLEKKESQIKEMTRQLEDFRQSLKTAESELIKLRKEKSALECAKPFTSTPVSGISYPSPDQPRLEMKLVQKEAEIEVLRHEVSELKAKLGTVARNEMDRSIEELRDSRYLSLVEPPTRDGVEHTVIEKSVLDDSLPYLKSPKESSVQMEVDGGKSCNALAELQLRYQRKQEQCDYAEKECDILRETVHDIQNELREALRKIGDQDRLVSALQSSKKALVEELSKIKSTSKPGADEDLKGRLRTLQEDYDGLITVRDSLMSDVDKLKSDLTYYEESLLKLESEQRASLNKIEELERLIGSLRRELKEKSVAKEELHKDLIQVRKMASETQMHLKEANEKMQSELQRASDKVNSIKEENLKLEKALSNIREANERTQKEKNDLSIENDNLNKAVVNLENSLSVLNEQFLAQTNELTDLRNQHLSVYKDQERVMEKLKEKERGVLQAQNENKFLNLKLNEVNNSIEVLKGENSYLNQNLFSVRETVQDLTKENERLQRQITDLRNQLDNDVMKASVDDLFDKVEDELGQTVRYDQSVLAYVQNLNSPNLLPTPDWSCDEDPSAERGNQVESFCDIESHIMKDGQLAKKIHSEGMKVLALSEDLYARQQGTNPVCNTCGRDEISNITPIVRPESPSRWRTKAFALEQEVERLKTELNIERMISENQKKSKESTEQHLLSVVNTLNKDRSSAHTSQGEIMTLKDQIQTLRLELVSSNEEVKSLRYLLSSDQSTSTSDNSSKSSINLEMKTHDRDNKKLLQQCSKLRGDREKLKVTIKSLNEKIAKLQGSRCLLCDDSMEHESNAHLLMIADQPLNFKEMVLTFLSRALKAESSVKALIYQKRYMEKIIEAQRAEVTVRNMCEYSDSTRIRFRSVAWLVISCLRMKSIIRLRTLRLDKLKKTLCLNGNTNGAS